MSKWTAVILVPTVVELEYANNITAAMRNTQQILKELKPVDQHVAKLLELRGPKEDVEAWSKTVCPTPRDTPPTNPPIGGGNGGGHAA